MLPQRGALVSPITLDVTFAFVRDNHIEYLWLNRIAGNAKYGSLDITPSGTLLFPNM